MQPCLSYSPGHLTATSGPQSFPSDNTTACRSSSPLDVILPVQDFHVIVLQSQVRETKPVEGEARAELSLGSRQASSREPSLYRGSLPWRGSTFSKSGSWVQYKARAQGFGFMDHLRNDPRVRMPTVKRCTLWMRGGGGGAC